MADEKTVLHIGPVNARGGISNFIRLMSENALENWQVKTLSTFAEGSKFAKYRRWRNARKELIEILQNSRPDIVHVHSASDYSWWRKKRVVKICRKAGIPVVIHFHSGKFHDFCASGKGVEVLKICSMPGVQPVVLSEGWAKRLNEWLPDATVICVPVEEQPKHDVKRESRQLLFMGRNDPIKGAAIAVEAARNCGIEVSLFMTGIEGTESWIKEDVKSGLVKPLGWVQEETKSKLMQQSTLIMVPSEFEGQPAVVLEAMANGLPVIGSSAVAETLGDAGLILQSLDPQVWSESLTELLNSEDLERMSKAGIERVKQHSIGKILHQWDSLYSNVIHETNS